MSNLNKTGFAAAGLLVGMLAAVAAGAQTLSQDSDVPQIALKYRAAQLNTDQGVRQLYASLQMAAKEVCPEQVGAIPSGAILACRQQAVQTAVARIHSERLAALSSLSLKRG